MEIKYLSKGYKDANFFVLGKPKATGEVFLLQTGFSICLYLREVNVNSEPPHTSNAFFISPLTNPYINIKGHHYIDLSFYSNFTVMSEPPKICFHDITGDPGIVINFSDKEAYAEFSKELGKSVFIFEQDLPGYYKINMLMPSISGKFELKNDPKPKASEYINLDMPFITKECNELIAGFRKEIQNYNDNTELFSEQDFNEALKDDTLLKKYALRHMIPPKYKAIVWSRISMIGDLPEINPYIFESYFRVKKQWDTLCLSQKLRCPVFVNLKKKIWKEIMDEKQKFLCIIPSNYIYSIAFDVMMTVCQMFYDLQPKSKQIMPILRSAIAMFTRKVIFDENRKPLYVVNDEITLNQDKLEAAVFWTILVILMKGEARFFLSGEQKDIMQTIPKCFDMLVNSFSQNFLNLVRSNGHPRYESLIDIYATGFSSVLPFYDCADLWILALSSNNMMEFFNCFASISFMFVHQFINLLQRPIDIGQSIVHSLKFDNNNCWDIAMLVINILEKKKNNI